MIETIQTRIASLPEQRRQLFAQLFDVDVTTGHALPPPEMEGWVIQQFGALEPVREQTIVKIVNRLTLESALFNPLRARRPTRPGGGPSSIPSTSSGQAQALEEWIARRLARAGDLRRATPAALWAGAAARLFGCGAALAGGGPSLRPPCYLPDHHLELLAQERCDDHAWSYADRAYTWHALHTCRALASCGRVLSGARERELFRRSVCAARWAGAGDPIQCGYTRLRAFDAGAESGDRVPCRADRETRRQGDRETRRR